MESEAALKKIIRGSVRSKPTKTKLDTMSRVELALRAVEEAILWGNLHMVTPDDLYEFKSGLMKFAEEEEQRDK